MSGWAVVLVLLGATALALWIRAWRDRRALTDPTRDPGATRVSAGARAALEALLAERRSPAEAVAKALEICAVDERISWRAGLRRVGAQAAELGSSPDERALAAEYALRMGQVTDARACLDRIPADHWRACRVRAGLYAIAGDHDRAESAWVAVAQLGPASVRSEAYARLQASRHRRGITVPAFVARWEQPPEPVADPVGDGRSTGR